MLKRLSILTIALLYLITTSGFALSLHYCGKLLTGVEINAPAKSCVKLVRLKCCKDKQILIKVKDAHQSATFAFNTNNYIIALPQQVFGSALIGPLPTVCINTLNKAPPDSPYHPVPIFIQNCTFRI